MAITLPLDQMSLDDKLAAMELLWADLANTPGAVESPGWHGEILDERRQRAANGSARFVDWEAAKADLRNRTR